jgi:alkylation response protein AidB-like acyl-CoA dehydrogenase
MDFRFTPEQLEFRDSVAAFLANECTPEHLRKLLKEDVRFSKERWKGLADLGVMGFFVPEDKGGLGLSAVDFVLIAEACGLAALPENFVEQAAIAMPLFAGCVTGPGHDEIMSLFAQGETLIGMPVPGLQTFSDADIASVIILSDRDGRVLAVPRDGYDVTPVESIDPFRRLFTVEIKNNVLEVADAALGSQLWTESMERGALFAAAQLVGLAQGMINMAVAYAKERKQFGQAIGSFQAVKHHLASAQVAIEFARPAVYKAAYAVAHDIGTAQVATSHAKIAAGDAAMQAAKVAIQVHGAMGYTFEVDLHLWMKRAWALIGAIGDRNYHLDRVAGFVLDDNAPLGADNTFRYSA